MLVKPEARLRRQNRIRTIQSSLAIEGNTLDIENITAILDNHKIIGPEKDIIEVQNAIKAYNELNSFNPFTISHSPESSLPSNERSCIKSWRV